MHIPLQKYKGKRREGLPAQRGKAYNSTGALTRFVGSGSMRVFLRDSIGVVSRPIGLCVNSYRLYPLIPKKVQIQATIVLSSDSPPVLSLRK